MSILKYFVASALALSLIACGGGGGSSGISLGSSSVSTATNATSSAVVTTGNTNTSSTVISVTTTTTVSSVQTPTLKISLVNSTGSIVSEVESSGGYSVEAKLLDSKGAVVPNKLVTFSIVGAAIAAFSPQTALTNAQGVAKVTITPVGLTSAGAATLVALANVASVDASDRIDFAVLPSRNTANAVSSIKASIVSSIGSAVINVTSAGGFFAEAKLLDASGNAIVNKLVSFNLTGVAVAGLSPLTALSNSSGVARVSIAPLSGSSLGAATLVTSANLGALTVTDQADFSVTGTGSTSFTPTLKISIVNSLGVVVSNVSSGGGFSAEAKLLNSDGVAVPNRLVTFNIAGAAIASLSPATAITNASGIARVAIAPSSLSSVGAASIIAAANVEATALTDQTDFAVSAASVSLSALSAGASNLVSGGNTQLFVSALVGGVPVSGIPVNVAYSSSCGRINGVDSSAGAVSITTNGSGLASASYEAVTALGDLCNGTVVVSASTAGATPSTLNLTVAAPIANAITYAGASLDKIFVAGTGALEQSVVKFKVLSSAGTPLPNVAVTFSIVINPGGVGLGAASTIANVSATTNSSGVAQVAVFSGTIPGPVKVRAELVSNATVFAETQNLTVASGPPSQKFMSLSVQTSNIEGQNFDGATTVLTARVADRQGNAVEDGTVVNFTAEGGQVAVSCATARINGISQCSVNFQSQNPRPSGGRVSVLAYLAGTKDYDDTNGNNRYDAGVDVLKQIGDAYRDDNENLAFDPNEFVIPRGGTAACAGSGSPFPSKLNTCDANLATTVRQQAILLNASSSPSLTTGSLNPLYSTFVRITPDPSGASGTITRVAYSAISINLRSANNTLLPLPAGTAVTAEGAGVACAVDKSFGSPVPNVFPSSNSLEDLATRFTATLKECFGGEDITFKVTVPSGLATTFSLRLP
jgi:hypothetical protein